MIALANRPGFPFLGNDFFGESGDCFSCFVVDNPSADSEVALLRQYAPSVNETLLRSLSDLFQDLRQMSNEGLLNYPYSLRYVI